MSEFINFEGPNFNSRSEQDLLDTAKRNEERASKERKRVKQAQKDIKQRLEKVIAAREPEVQAKADIAEPDDEILFRTPDGRPVYKNTDNQDMWK